VNDTLYGFRNRDGGVAPRRIGGVAAMCILGLP
jgi:hypothetical protein